MIAKGKKKAYPIVSRSACISVKRNGLNVSEGVLFLDSIPDSIQSFMVAKCLIFQHKEVIPTKRKLKVNRFATKSSTN